MGADLFEDKFDGAVWALDHLRSDPLPPPGPNRPEMDADLHQVLTALVEHGHDGPFRVLGKERCAFLVLRSDWSWLRAQAGNLGLDEGHAGAEPLPGRAGHPDGAGAINGVNDAGGTDGGGGTSATDTPDCTGPPTAPDADVAHAAGRADVFDDPDRSGRADPADVADSAERSDHADGTPLERTNRADPSDSPTPSPFPHGRPPVVETEADLERALAALNAQGFPDRAFALCREGGRKGLAAVLSARAYDRPVAWLAEHAPKKVLRGLLSEVVMAVQQVRLTERVPERSVNSGFLPDIGEVRSRRRPRSVLGEKTLTLPTSVRRVVRGEHGTRVETEVVLPKAENSRTLEGPDGSEQIEGTDGAESSDSPDGHVERGTTRGPAVGTGAGDVGDGGGPGAGGYGADGSDGRSDSTTGSMFGPSSGPHSGGVHSLDPVVGPRRGMPGQLATIRWEGFSRAWDDLGNRYVLLFEVEKGQPGLSSFLGMEVVTQTLFPALDDDATQLMLLNPGHLVTRAPTIDGQVSGRPSVRTVPDGNVVTVNLRKQRKQRTQRTQRTRRK